MAVCLAVLRGETVFVKRGWVPKNMRDYSRPEGTVEIIGEVQFPEKASGRRHTH